MTRGTLALLLAVCANSACHAEGATRVVLVVGAAGTEEYGQQFAEWAGRVEEAARLGGAELVTIGGETTREPDDRSELQQALKDVGDSRQLWLVMIGHGTFDGKTARFNLRGPDVSADELAKWLSEVPCPAAIVNCSSASGPFLEPIAGTARTVVTAAKSGDEHNFSRFGDYFSRSLTELEADLNKDDQVSLLEAFLFASRRVEEFYAGQNRLATEHALLEDNGDGQGIGADWFEGVRLAKQAQDAGATPDGQRAHELHLVASGEERKLSPADIARRNDLERELAALTQRKADISADEYYQAAEAIALELAQIYQAK